MPLSFGFGNKSVVSKGNKSSIVTDNLVYQLVPSSSFQSEYSISGTTTNDFSGQGNVGSLANGVKSYNSQFVFDGVNDIINIPYSSSLALGQTFSIGVWVRASVLGSTSSPGDANINNVGNRQIIYSTRLNNPAGCFQLELTGTTVSVTGVGTFIIMAGTLTANTWYYITYVRNGSGSGTIYINGVAQTPSVTTAYTFIENTDTRQIGGGGSTGTGQPFNGRLGDLQLYKRALTQQEVLQNYNSSKTQYELFNSVALHLDAGNSYSYSGSGTTWTDLSGNNRHATLVNSPTYNSSGGYFSLDNVDDWVDISVPTNNSSFTFETLFYAKRDTSGTSNYAYLFCGPDSVNTAFSGGLAINEGGAATAGGQALSSGQMYLSDSVTVYPFNYVIPDQEWTHIVLTWDVTSDEVKLYANGVLKDTKTNITRILSAIEYYSRLSTNGFLGHPANGDVATIKVYQKALSSSEVFRAYQDTQSTNQSWAPTDISNISLWLKADASGAARDSSDNAITSDNTKLYKLVDFSGLGNHAIQATSSKQPSYRTAANGISGNPAIQFATNILQVPNFSRGAWTTFTVFKCSSTTLLYEQGPGWSTPGGYLYTSTGASIHIKNAANNTYSAKNYSANWGSDNTTKLATHRFNGTQASHILRVNGTEVSMTDTPNFVGSPGTDTVTDTLNIGGRNGTGLGAFYLCEMIMYNRALTDTEAQTIENYLKAKWGIS